MKPALTVALLSALIAGCAADPQWGVISGSRQDGTVTLGYQRTRLWQPYLQISDAQAIARHKCENWGYADAEAFGAVTAGCGRTYQGDCIAGVYKADFQCVGAPSR